MEAWQHVSASVLLASLLFLFPPFDGLKLSYLIFGVACGSLIDLDHLLASRIRHGDWHHLKNILSKPFETFTDYTVSKDDIEDSYFGSIKQIYISHTAVATIITAPIYLHNQDAGITVAAFFTLHLLMDLIGLLRLAQKGG